MLEYHLVDNDGKRLDVVLLSVGDEIPPNHFLGWGDRRFFNPIWDFDLNDWVESLTQEEIDDIMSPPDPEVSEMDLLRKENEAMKDRLLQLEMATLSLMDYM